MNIGDVAVVRVRNSRRPSHTYIILVRSHSEGPLNNHSSFAPKDSPSRAEPDHALCERSRDGAWAGAAGCGVMWKGEGGTHPSELLSRPLPHSSGEQGKLRLRARFARWRSWQEGRIRASRVGSARLGSASALRLSVRFWLAARCRCHAISFSCLLSLSVSLSVRV